MVLTYAPVRLPIPAPILQHVDVDVDVDAEKTGRRRRGNRTNAEQNGTPGGTR